MPWGLMAIFYGAIVAMLAGTIVPTIFQDEDLRGWVVWVYYPAMGIGTIVMAAVAIWFRKLVVWVDSTHVAFGYGKFRKRFHQDQIRTVKSTPYSFVKYGGSGIRYARGGHRAWSVPFLHTGVELELEENGKDRTYYISSRRPAELELAISRRLTTDQAD